MYTKEGVRERVLEGEDVRGIGCIRQRMLEGEHVRRVWC